MSAFFACLLMSVISFLGALVSTQMSSFVEYSCLIMAAATMTADALLHLLPEAHEANGNMSVALVGIATVILTEQFGFGYANLLAEALHNFIDGVALSAAFGVSREVGLATTVAVALHEIPQELGDVAILKRAGLPVMTMNVAVSLTAFLGLLVPSHPSLLALTGGSFVGLGLFSVAPQAIHVLHLHARKHGKVHYLWAIFLAFSSCAFLALFDDH